MRSRDELQREYDAALADRAELHRLGASQRHLDRCAGVADALGWVLGLCPAPITETPPGTVTAADAGREMNLALDVIYGRNRAPENHIARPRAAGIEHALLWASQGTRTPPITEETAPARRSTG